MSMKKMTSKFNSVCAGCGKPISKGSTILYAGYKRAYHETCAANQDHSSQEDSCCGDMAYEDRCAEMAGVG